MLVAEVGRDRFPVLARLPVAEPGEPPQAGQDKLVCQCQAPGFGRRLEGVFQGGLQTGHSALADPVHGGRIDPVRCCQGQGKVEFGDVTHRRALVGSGKADLFPGGKNARVDCHQHPAIRLEFNHGVVKREAGFHIDTEFAPHTGLPGRQTVACGHTRVPFLDTGELGHVGENLVQRSVYGHGFVESNYLAH